jgi:hypothetical protein
MGYRVFLEAGVHGRTAAQTADRLKGSAAVVGGPRDGTGARILVQALIDAGIECGRPLLGEADEVMGRLEKRVESLAVMDLPLSEEAFDLSGAFMIGTGQEGSFREEGKALVRENGGRAASLPSWVRKIHLVHSGDHPPEVGDDELLAYVVSKDGEDPAPWIRAMKPEQLRFIAGDDLRLLEALIPGPRIRMVLGFREICTDPLEEMYAGNSLPDRNAELIENIVP